MSFNYAEKNTPFVLSPQSLDEYLAKGWYRMGASIFTTHFLFFNQQPYSAVWIRLDLQDFAFSKSQRKLMRRNAQTFTVASGPRQIDAERENLYHRYAEDFDGRLSNSISDSLEDYGEDSVFNTLEISVRDTVSKQLVANSYFDVGDTSAASILGIYDPLLKSFSLGYYTMLLEIQWCLDNGLRYYYPGYVVPGYGRFDYKLRLGKSQYYNIQTDKWLPFANEAVDAFGPAEVQRKHLLAMVEGLATNGIHRELLVYPLFEADLHDVWNKDYLPYPYLVYLGNEPEGHPVVLVYDPKEMMYMVVACAHLIQPQMLFNTSYLKLFEQGNFYARLLTNRGVLYQGRTVEEVLPVITRGLQGR
ncbi:hypothetical protein [Lewinella sp. 4G2]|uniref:hypothetical protein n=1 Tax=Lewinella sp. 4G2 TaxID=1803372 RepID=UPI0007B4DC97|nr:hypothetical protein [Lewinella sp. 4G2]OAV45487.1 hypothetical protein A3850_013755 [Lewinella sp. 4G2]